MSTQVNFEASYNPEIGFGDKPYIHKKEEVSANIGRNETFKEYFELINIDDTFAIIYKNDKGKSIDELITLKYANGAPKYINFTVNKQNNIQLYYLYFGKFSIKEEEYSAEKHDSIEGEVYTYCGKQNKRIYTDLPYDNGIQTREINLDNKTKVVADDDEIIKFIKEYYNKNTPPEINELIKDRTSENFNELIKLFNTPIKVCIHRDAQIWQEYWTDFYNRAISYYDHVEVIDPLYDPANLQFIQNGIFDLESFKFYWEYIICQITDGVPPASPSNEFVTMSSIMIGIYTAHDDCHELRQNEEEDDEE